MKKILPLLLLSLNLAAEEELSLDPNDIPLPADSSMSQPLNEFEPSAPAAQSPTTQAPEAQSVAPQAPAKDPVSIAVPVDELTRKELPKEQHQEQPKEVILRSEPAIATPDNMKPHHSEASVNNEPNVRLEEKFNRIYEQYNKAETPTENWEKVVGSRKAEIYVVQKGDTLWDISKTLFGDPFFWPKIWALNKETIFNPHEIDPKMNIKFFPGSEGQVPSLAMVHKGEVSEAPPEDLVNKSKKSDADAKPEKDGPKDRKVSFGTSLIPKSFPDYFVNSPKNEKTIKLEERVVKHYEPQIPLEFVMKETEIEGSGKIAETELGSKSAAMYQYIYVKLNEGNAQHYTVLKPAKAIKDPHNPEINIHLYEVQGEIEVLNRVNAEENVYRAMVKKSRAFVSSGSILVPGSMRMITAEESAEVASGQAQIIGNLNDNKLIAKNTFVVINQGAQNGYTQGKVLPIYMNTNNRNEKSLVTENQQKIGRIKIVDATENYSVGYVLKIYEQVYVRDFVGANNTGSAGTASAEHLDSGDAFTSGSDQPATQEGTTTEQPAEGTPAEGTSTEGNPESLDSGNF